jgi:hypothetical protein
MPALKSDGSLQNVALSLLHLDDANPRFGGRNKKKRSEVAILDEIVSQHGITDVICSISANGFFDSEPLVGAINKSHGDKVTIVEGNRRLTACLIIARDPRAKNHESLSERYQKNSFSATSKLPVQIYDWANEGHRNKLLPYVGIRHIVGATQWDSYAKAAWVAMTLKESNLSIDDIRTMIGDDQKFIDRIVEGYHFVEQILRTNAYDPAESLRKGRGSFQEFPFSWIYTTLGYKSVRKFVCLDSDNLIEPDPIPEESLEDAGKLLGYLFGASGRNAAIDDSRKIGKLAQALSSEESVAALDKGESAEDALEQLRPPEQRFSELLKRADATIAKCVALASGFKGLDRKTISDLQERTEDVGSRIERLCEVLDSIKPKPGRVKKKVRD